MCEMSTSLSKTNIKEANEHLQQLHQRIFELETQLQLHSLHVEDLQRSNTELQRQLTLNKELADAKLREKEGEVTELRGQLEEKEEQVQRLLLTAEDRDQALIKMEAKTRIFYEVTEHKTALAQILRVLEEISQSK